MSNNNKRPDPDHENTLDQKEFAKFLYKNIGDPSINRVFSNRVVAILQDSNILLYFGIDAPAGTGDNPEENEVRYSTCVSMSHAYFMNTMEYLAARYYALQDLYGDNPISAGGVKSKDPGSFDRAMMTMSSGIFPIVKPDEQ